MRANILIIVVLLYFFFHDCYSAIYETECDEPKNCSANISQHYPNKKKMLMAIKECLLEDYTENESKLIPPQGANETFQIRYKYFINDLISVEKDGVEVEVVMNLIWKDDCLRWVNKEFPYIMMNAQDIWRPPTFISSALSPISSPDDNQIIVHSNGICEESLLFKLKIICEDFPLYFPNDYQLCKVNFNLKLNTNFTLTSFTLPKNICETETVALEEWYIDCSEFYNYEDVKKTTEHWPFLTDSNSTLYMGNITGVFPLLRFPHSTFSSIVLPSVIVCVCSQIISVLPPHAQNFATIISSLFLSLTMLLNNIPSFNKFALFSLLLNWIYFLCASNVIISIIGNTVINRKKACLPQLQRFYHRICQFTRLPISLVLILSLSITCPMIGALLLKRIYGFISGFVCMIIIWIIITVYKVFAVVLPFRSALKEEKKDAKSASGKTPTSLMDAEAKSQLIKLTQAVSLLTSAMQHYAEQHSPGDSQLRARSTAARDGSSDRNSRPNLSIEQADEQAETQIDANIADRNKLDESPPNNEEKVDFEMLGKKEKKTGPESIAEWNAKLALCICRIWTCCQILGNIFLNVTLWVVYYRFWKDSF